MSSVFTAKEAPRSLPLRHLGDATLAREMCCLCGV